MNIRLRTDHTSVFVDELLRENKRLRAALEAYPEWLNETDEDGVITGAQYCLICNETELRGHKSDCLRVLALEAVANCHKITTNEAGEPAEKTG